MHLHRNLQFFRDLEQDGRPDLAGDNAAADNRLLLAAIYYRRAYPGLSLEHAHKMAQRVRRHAEQEQE